MSRTSNVNSRKAQYKCNPCQQQPMGKRDFIKHIEEKALAERENKTTPAPHYDLTKEFGWSGVYIHGYRIKKKSV